MNWNIPIKGYKSFLTLERSLSDNSIDAYVHDVEKLVQFLEAHQLDLSPRDIRAGHLQDFLQWVAGLGMGARSQARMISGIKGFDRYLLLENSISHDPTELLEAPQLGRRLPETLSIEDIDAVINAIDLSKPEGQRNKAMLETLYSCG